MKKFILILFILVVIIAFILVFSRITGGVGDFDPVNIKDIKETLCILT